MPALAEIPGDERVDKLEKEAGKNQRVDIKIKLSKSEGKSSVWREIKAMGKQKDGIYVVSKAKWRNGYYGRL